MKLSTQDAVVLHLADNRGKWIPSCSLDQVTLNGKFTGMSGSRRASDCARKGYHAIKGTKYFIESRRHGKIFEYRCVGGKRNEQKVQMIETPDGLVAKLAYEEINV